MALGGHKILIAIETDTEKMRKDLQAAQLQLGETNFLAESLNSTIAASKYYAIAAGGSFAAMVLPTVFASRAVGDLDDNLHRLAGVGGSKYKAVLGDMADQMTAFSVQYGTSTGDISAAAVEFAKTGYQVKETMDLLDPTMKLAIANQVDAASAAQLMNNAYVLFGKNGAETVTSLADKIQAAANASKMDILDLFEAFQYSGSAASVASISFDQYVSMVGALSQIAAGAGESIGTLMTRMYTNAEQMEEILGDSGIVDEANGNVIDLTKLMTALGNSSAETREQLFTLWGVRNAKNFAQLYNATSEYNEILGKVQNSTGTLDKAAAEMSGSITAMWNRIMAVIAAPLSNTEVMGGLTMALQRMYDVFSSPAMGQGLVSVVMTSANYLVNNGPRLLSLITDLMTMVVNFLPILQNLADQFLALVGLVSWMDPNLISMFAAVAIGMKIMPGFIQLIEAVGLASKAAFLSTSQFRLGTVLFFMFISLVLTQKDPLVKALAAIAAAVTALALAFLLLKSIVMGPSGALNLSSGMSAFATSINAGKNVTRLGSFVTGASKLQTAGILGMGLLGAGVPLLMASGDYTGGGEMPDWDSDYSRYSKTGGYAYTGDNYYEYNNYQFNYQKQEQDYMKEVDTSNGGGH